MDQFVEAIQITCVLSTIGGLVMALYCGACLMVQAQQKSVKQSGGDLPFGKRYGTNNITMSSLPLAPLPSLPGVLPVLQSPPPPLLATATESCVNQPSPLHTRAGPGGGGEPEN